MTRITYQVVVDVDDSHEIGEEVEIALREVAESFDSTANVVEVTRRAITQEE